MDRRAWQATVYEIGKESHMTLSATKKQHNVVYKRR